MPVAAKRLANRAPHGGEALYVLVHTSYLRAHHDWKQMFPKHRAAILDKLRRTAGLNDIESRIRFEAHLTPENIHNRYRVLNGAIYGIASHGRMKGVFRPVTRAESWTIYTSAEERTRVRECPWY